MDTEEWREVPGFDGAYEASSLGRIRRTRNAGRGGPPVAGLIMKVALTKEGYHRVGLFTDGRQRHFFVHRIVATTFHGPQPPGRPTVNHRDGVKVNNRPENVEWASKSENYRHALDVLGFQPPRGVAHWNAKRTPEIIFEVRRRLDAGESGSSIGRDLGIAPGNISLIKNRKLWAHV